MFVERCNSARKGRTTGCTTNTGGYTRIVKIHHGDTESTEEREYGGKGVLSIRDWVLGEPRWCGRRRMTVHAALRESVASRLPSSEGLGGGFTDRLWVMQGSVHCKSAQSFQAGTGLSEVSWKSLAPASGRRLL
jgi:hypothetical protein